MSLTRLKFVVLKESTLMSLGYPSDFIFSIKLLCSQNDIIDKFKLRDVWKLNKPREE